ncbi:MAG TPA: aldo/keto reductase [Burkholderiales bacterium]|nr:aldo/keto reductase [Burkholderiales bacterium]
MIFAPTAHGVRLGLGGAPLGNMYAAVDDGEAQAALQAAFADGCRTFDTAPHYGNGRSEERFGRFLQGEKRATCVLSSKVGRLLIPDANAPREFGPYVDVLPNIQRFDYSAAGVRQCLHDSLERLGAARLDVCYVHDCSALTHGERAEAVFRQVVDETLPALRALQREGSLRYVGVAVSDWRVCLRILREADLDCVLLAGRYTLLDQSALPQLLPLCEARGVRIAVGGPFNSGILASGVKGSQPLRFNYEAAPPQWIARAAAIEAVCERFDVPLRAAALQFPLAHPAVEIILVGVKRVAHWRDALAKMTQRIPGAFWEALRAEKLLPEAAPTP